MLGQQVGKGAQATVYLSQGRAVKLYRQGYPQWAVYHEAAVTLLSEGTGLPVPHVHDVVRHEDSWALVMDYIPGDSLNARERLSDFVALQCRMHGTSSPIPIEMHTGLYGIVAKGKWLSPRGKKRLSALLDSLPRGLQLCHCDYHPINIVDSRGELTILDWIDAKAGNPCADCCRTYLVLFLFDEALAKAYLDIYCAQAGVAREDVLAWLPLMAAQRLEEGYERERERLLRLAGE